jgi:predicted hydrocarbon binding protein
VEATLKKLHTTAYFVSALASAIEKNLGKGSHSICALAGKKFGAGATKMTHHTTDPLEAIVLLHTALKEDGILWDFEIFPGENESAMTTEGTSRKIRLVFKTCMVRNALFCYAHPQKESLCSMAHGAFAGALQQIMPGYKAELNIIHAGPNGCLKELVIMEEQ